MINEATTLRYRGRRVLVLGAMAMLAGALLWRAVDLQLSHNGFLKTEGNARHLRVVTIPATRGQILDRNGETLAISTPVDSVWVHPGELAAQREGWRELSRLLGLKAGRLERIVEQRQDREFVYLQRHVEPDRASKVMQLKIPGVYRQREYRRYYPTGEVMAHVVGFTDVDDSGQEGIELAYDSVLKGVDGAKRVVRDRLGQIVEDVESIREARNGRSVTLSIDRRIQYLAYRALKAAVKRHRARAGSVVVLDARTGEVLAMVNQPAFNPNNRADRAGERYRNRAVTDLFEPGSTIKPFTVASALETGRFRPGTLIDTSPGFMKIGKHRVRDLRDYGVINLATVLQKSSNVGASKVALEVPPDMLWGALARMGFGSATGSGFPGEAPGTLVPYVEGREIQRATLAFGYGMSVTPLQLAHAYTVFASGGLLRPVTFKPVPHSPHAVEAMPEDIALEVRRMLEAVVGEGGTASEARVPGYRVAGKTGTVRKAIPGGYAKDRYVGIFAGMAPASAPRLVIVATIDEPRGKEYYGGKVAAPVFAETMAGALRLLGAVPDDPDRGHGRIALLGRGAEASGASSQ